MTGRSRVRAASVGVMVALAGVAALVSIFTIWAARTVLDTDRFTAVVAEVLDEPEVIEPVAAVLTEELLGLVERSGAVEGLVPDPLRPLVPVLDAAVRSFVADRVGELLLTEPAQQTLEAAVRRSHGAIVALLRGDGLVGTRVIGIESGEVRLDLAGLLVLGIEELSGRGLLPDRIDPGPDASLDAAALRDRLESSLDIRLDDEFATVVVYQSDALARAEVAVAGAQYGFALAERGLVLFVVLAGALAAGALGLSLDRRRTAIQLGIAFAVAGLVATILGRRLVEALPAVVSDPAARAAAARLASGFAGGLIRVAEVVLVLGAAAAVIGVLFGPGPAGDWIRTALADRGGAAQALADRADAVRVGALVLAGVLLVWWGWSPLVLVVVLAVAALGLLAPWIATTARPARVG